MNDFAGSDYGFRRQGKAAPMAAARSLSTNSVGTRSTSTMPGYSSFMNGDDSIFNPTRGGSSGFGGGFGDVFGGRPDFDNMFGGGKVDAKGSGPAFDDEEEDVFAGVPGTANFENMFTTMASPENMSSSSTFDYLLRGIGGINGVGAASTKSFKEDDVDSLKKSAGDFDDLLPGFGVISPPSARHTADIATKCSSHVKEDPISGIDSPLAHEGTTKEDYLQELDQVQVGDKCFVV